MTTTCVVNTTKGRVCDWCGKPFKKNELVFSGPNGLTHSDGCLKKPLNSAEPAIASINPTSKPITKGKPENTVKAKADDFDASLSHKLVDDINAMGAKNA